MSAHLPVVLLTGFAPFEGESVNPSLEIARALDGAVIAGHRIVAGMLPTEFATSLTTLARMIEQHDPVLVLSLGQAGGSSGISLERVAINLVDARIADNAGAQPIDERVVDDAPNAYFSTLPVKSMLARLLGAGIPAALSHSAGTFVCNQVFFGLAHLLAARYPRRRGGFMHVPYLPEQAMNHRAAPSMALETMIDAVRLCLDTALTTTTDARYPGGSTH